VRVRVVVRDAGKKLETEANFPKVEAVVGDLGDDESLAKALQGVDRLLLSPPGVANRLELALKAIAAAKKAGVQFITVISVVGASAEGVDVAKEFAVMEKAVEESGMKYCLLRCGGFMDNFLSQAGGIKGEWHAIMGGSGDGALALIASADIGRVAAKVLAEDPQVHAGKTYNLTGPESMSFGQYAEHFSKRLGFAVSYKDMSPEEWGKTLGTWGVPAFMCKILTDLNGVYRAGYANFVSADVLTLTGRHVTIDEWIDDNAAAFGGEVTGTLGKAWWAPKTQAGTKIWWA
jgi:uncharacterized protein YbjT (DUF2867 family)